MIDPVRRHLMDEIDWSQRMIGIKGARGVGKTTFLLQYARDNFPSNTRKCLYINMNNFYLQGISLSEFAGRFHDQGGEVLLIDQVFKADNWSQQLRECYDNHPALKIIFTGSSVMRLKEENPELHGIVKSYNLRGFSFREFLNLKTGHSFPSYTLDEILHNHAKIEHSVLSRVQPASYFQDYIHHGFYPFFLEKRNYSENLLGKMNTAMEVDILLVKQVEQKCLTKIKKLFYLLAVEDKRSPNVSHLAKEIGVSRATVMNYIKYLADARLLNMIYENGDSFPKKPSRVMLHNSNLIYAIYPIEMEYQDIMETFFVNALWKDHKVFKGSNVNCYTIDSGTRFRVCDTRLGEKMRLNPDVYYARWGNDRGDGNQIPIWMFGFLY